MFALQMIGPAIFLLVGGGMLVAGLNAPVGATTDDGYPRGPFLLLLGGVFLATAAIWAVVAIRGLGWSRRARALAEARREHLRQNGVELWARVVSCTDDGYLNFEGELWCDVVLDYADPGIPQQSLSRRLALPFAVVEKARKGGPILLLVDPAAPAHPEIARTASRPSGKV